MKKETVEYFRQNKCRYGYSYFISPRELSETYVLDFLVKWSKNKNVRIYSHSLRKEEINLNKYKKKHIIKADCYCGEIQIPYCDWVYYLDIYYQNK